MDMEPQLGSGGAGWVSVTRESRGCPCGSRKPGISSIRSSITRRPQTGSVGHTRNRRVEHNGPPSACLQQKRVKMFDTKRPTLVVIVTFGLFCEGLHAWRRRAMRGPNRTLKRLRSAPLWKRKQRLFRKCPKNGRFLLFYPLQG